MNDYIEIETVQLNNDRQTVQENIRKIGDELEHLSESVGRLNGMWSGPANAAYNQQTGHDFEEMNRLLTEIADFVQCMEFAASEYVKCEDSVADSVAGIRI